ncbi:HNH endonuclease [Deinococcus arcticus]|uniref:HNH nuclease domain-containing protein n=1 Tax=Deinococcus arcticus TaxID=2136176 RepID=A0A2T3WD16_9DEIO|nr:HNH endonuclease [Deinococcus arcticus]PTA69786.1 hypothetical protein C8263_01880 [Deinococcus arcticus]
MNSETRTCRVCRRPLSIENFPKNRPDGSRHYRCLDCQAAAYRQRYGQDDRRRAFQIAYSMNGSVLRRFPHLQAVEPGWLAQLFWATPACAYCGLPNEQNGLGFQIDHIQPLSRGGRHEPQNLVLACAQCNRAKWNLTRAEFEEWLARAAQRLTQKPPPPNVL